MKAKTLLVALSASTLVLAGASWAGPGRGCDGPMGWEMGSAGGRPAMMRGDPAVHLERRLDYLKHQLKITPEQEPLWQAYAEASRAEAGKGWDAREALAKENLPAPERLQRMEKLLEDRLAAMKTVHERFARLYETLSPEQKAQADLLFAQRMMRHRHAPQAPQKG